MCLVYPTPPHVFSIPYTTYPSPEPRTLETQRGTSALMLAPAPNAENLCEGVKGCPLMRKARGAAVFRDTHNVISDV
jgi:hypothetical protein